MQWIRHRKLVVMGVAFTLFAVAGTAIALMRYGNDSVTACSNGTCTTVTTAWIVDDLGHWWPTGINYTVWAQ